jgi:hypothetical protein
MKEKKSIRVRHKTIEFLYHPEQKYTIKPVPASKALPSWYKTALASHPDAKPWESGTFKSCMPFVDAMSLGYIIPLWTDILVELNDNPETEEKTPAFTWSPNMSTQMSGHSEAQVMGIPAAEKSTGRGAHKLICPWVIRTPPGYSCLYTAPLNQADDKIQIISGVVATDNYFNQVNFPFLWTGGDWEGILERGIPLVQVIPFRRDQFTQICRAITPQEQIESVAISESLHNDFGQGYKEKFRKYTVSK